jgi:hypothetical protein
MTMTIPFVEGSETSREAAEMKSKTSVERDREAILAALRHGPMTDEQIQETTGLGGNTERPRRVELVRIGAVVASEHRHKTASGRWAQAWAAK